jgi:hypothetical protein
LQRDAYAILQQLLNTEAFCFWRSYIKYRCCSACWNICCGKMPNKGISACFWQDQQQLQIVYACMPSSLSNFSRAYFCATTSAIY